MESTETCQTCLDCRYDLFKSVDIGRPQNDWPLPRYKPILFQELRSSVEQGCPMCSILDQGMQLHWGPNPEIIAGVPPMASRLEIERHPGRSLTVYRRPLNGVSGRFSQNVSSRVEFFTELGQQPLDEAFGPAREVQPVSDLKHSVRLIEQWIETCAGSHHGCLSLSSCLPDRVISVTGDKPVLIETGGDMTGQYITVSHSWGTAFGRKPMMTTKDNIDAHRQGILMDALPTLFQNFLQIAKSLKVGYVWIDSLCIIQDDAADWQQQAMKMGEYYANGYLNLAASVLQDSSQRLFFTRWHTDDDYTPSAERFTTRPVSTRTLLGSPSMGSRCVKVRLGNMGNHRFVQGQSINGLSRRNPLLERAWVFQEQMLSRRTIHFASSEIIWDCKTATACECYCLDLLSSQASEARQKIADFDYIASVTSFSSKEHSSYFWTRKQQLHQVLDMRSGANKREVLDLWLDLVERYVAGRLSFEADRSYAIAGIAGLFSSRLKCRFFYGMWTEDAARSLAWSPASRPTLESFRASDVPTWSWMSRCFAAGRNSWLVIRYNASAIDFVADTRFEANFREQHAETIDEEGLGDTFIANAACELAIRSAWFRVFVPVNYAVLLKRDTMDASSELLSESSNGLKLVLDFRPDWIDGPLGLNGGAGDVLKALVLGRSADKASQDYDLALLIVRKVATAHEFDIYERVGYARGPVLPTESKRTWDFIDEAKIGVFKLQ